MARKRNLILVIFQCYSKIGYNLNKLLDVTDRATFVVFQPPVSIKFDGSLSQTKLHKDTADGIYPHKIYILTVKSYQG